MTSEGPASPQLSIVIPVHNEAGNVAPLHAELTSVLVGLGRSYEILFIDDGSTDATPRELSALADADPRLLVLTLRRNFGQTAALAAGFDHAVGGIVVALDGDGQHDPADLPALVAAIDAGADVASGWRQSRATVDPWLRTLPSRVANAWIGRVADLRLHDFGTTFKAYRRELLTDLELHGDMHRFIPAVLHRRGARVVEVPIASRPRNQGTSHYGLGRVGSVLVDILYLKLLLTWMGRPLKAFASLGIPLFLAGLFVALAVTIQFYWFTPNIGYGNLILAALLMLLGAQFIGLGFIAELTTRSYQAASKKKIYAVSKVARRPYAGVTEETSSQ